MARNIGEELIASMQEAVAYAKGARKGYRIHTFEADDVRLIRAKTKKSQAEFSKAYHIALKTLQKWETGQAKPTGPAAALLRVIQARPQMVEKALEEVA